MLRSPQTQVLVYTGSVDMRKSIDGLCWLAYEHMNQNPASGQIFVFMNRGRDKVKLIYWDHNGFCLFYKRLETDRFAQWGTTDEVLCITPQELQFLMSGLPFKHWPKIAHKTFENYG